MLEINGKSVYNSLCMGKLYFYGMNKRTVKREKTDTPETEVRRFMSALTAAKKELHELYEKALLQVGEDNAQIFQIHTMMLDDEDFYGAVINTINVQKVNAEYAVSYTSDIFARTFREMDDEYMQARASDVCDISERLINLLSDNSGTDTIPEPSIIIADDLTPSETVQMDKDKILGFVTFRGSQTSHTAILARTMNIPAVINTGEISPEHHGKTAILDGFSGALYIDPDELTIQEYKKRKALEEERAKLLSELRGKPTETKSHKKVNLYANIGSPRDLAAAVQNDAEGIGLFRSEFLYLEASDFPTEDEQFRKYKEVAEGMCGKKVIVRTMDIGADKQIDYFKLPCEDNPALGFRAIRICLTDTKMFKTQLRALLRASAFGNISIMFPLITSLSEVIRAKALVAEAMQELEDEGIPYKKNIETGIMIETPAAAIICDMLAPEVDFFSIGTNDLTQYTLALDRQNSALEPFFDPHHPAILRLIENVIQNAHKHGKWVGICGELAADLTLTEAFVNMGIDELSVSPSFVLKVREKIRDLD
ncbi:MAG: phosphoenolpyruvate--protein phosphotransferase [Ruminococcaceae bacterium]|nr:phosphoenolpyruvate--protein phosphotransferase [Oscillospiraceae bacterium]